MNVGQLLYYYSNVKKDYFYVLITNVDHVRYRSLVSGVFSRVHELGIGPNTDISASLVHCLQMYRVSDVKSYRT